MSSDKEQKSEGIVPLGNQGLARYSSDLIRKGLDLARTLEQSGAAVEAERQAIWIKPDAAKPLTQIWKCVHTLTGHSQSITSVAISPDGQTIVSGDEDGIIKLWHIQTGKLLHTLNIDLDSNSDCQVAISSDGQLLACFFTCSFTDLG